MSIGKALADRHRITMVDLPDHGRSSWTERFDYLAVVEQVAGLLDHDDPVTLVGHSMGGKVAMLTALLHPAQVRRLAVVDMSPVRYDETPGGLGRYARALLDVDLASVSERADADAALKEAVRSPTVRAFLLQNLRRDEGPVGWRWQANLELLERDLPVIANWPEDRLADVPAYPGPVVWIAGELSDYVAAEYEPAMNRWFPRNRKVVVKNAGHWSTLR